MNHSKNQNHGDGVSCDGAFSFYGACVGCSRRGFPSWCQRLYHLFYRHLSCHHLFSPLSLSLERGLLVVERRGRVEQVGKRMEF